MVHLKMGQTKIERQLETALLKQGPVKLEINGRIDPYFCNILEIDRGGVVVDYHDHTENISFTDITDILI